MVDIYRATKRRGKYPPLVSCASHVALQDKSHDSSGDQEKSNVFCVFSEITKW